MVFNLFGLGKPDNDRSIDVILKEKMTPLRIDASHFCLAGLFTDDCYKRLVQKVKDVSKSFDDIDETVLQTLNMPSLYILLSSLCFSFLFPLSQSFL